MDSKTATLAVFSTIIWSMPALAQTSVQDRLANTEQRIQYLEKRIVAQDNVIVQKHREISKLKKDEAARADRWFSKIDLNGAVQLQASHGSPFTGPTTSDATVKEATIGLTTRVHDWVTAEIGLKYEEDDTPLEVDVATIAIAPPKGPWRLKGGQFTLPFGTFETNLVSTTLAGEVGETRETALSAGLESNGFSGTVYAFNGTNKEGGDSRIEGFGATAGYAQETGNSGFAVDVGYINDVGDSNNLQTTISDTLGSNNVSRHVGAWIVGSKVHYGPVSLSGEYLTAVEDFAAGEVLFNGAGAQPSAWSVETAYGFKIVDQDATVAVSYQGTDEALALSLPERRFLAGISVGIVEHASLAFEWAHDWGYGTGDGGTGKTADTVKAVLTVEF